MEIASLITGPVGVNTYIVYGKNAGECIIIDPSDTELVNKKLDELGVKPTAVLLTHGHFDHIVSVADLQKQYGARVYIHEIDEAGLRDASVNPGGDHKELLDSIGNQLFTLDGDYEVYPGHMGATTLQFEREHNPFMRHWGKDK